MAYLKELRGQHDATIFDGFEIIAEPLGDYSAADRERRVWQRGDGPGVTYGSHIMKLAQEPNGRGLFILVEHGGGREVLALSTGPDWRAMRAAFLAMDERTLYAVLYSVWQSVADIRRAAQDETAGDWRKAFVHKRIRRRAYPSRGIVKVWMEPECRENESDQQYKLRKVFAAPGSAWPYRCLRTSPKAKRGPTHV